MPTRKIVTCPDSQALFSMLTPEGRTFYPDTTMARRALSAAAAKIVEGLEQTFAGKTVLVMAAEWNGVSTRRLCIVGRGEIVMTRHDATKN